SRTSAAISATRGATASRWGICPTSPWSGSSRIAKSRRSASILLNDYLSSASPAGTFTTPFSSAVRLGRPAQVLHRCAPVVQALQSLGRSGQLVRGQEVADLQRDLEPFLSQLAAELGDLLDERCEIHHAHGVRPVQPRRQRFARHAELSN